MEMEGGWAETPVSMVEPSDLFLCCTCHECQLLLLDSQQLKTQLKKYVAMLGFGYLGNGKWVSMRGDYIILQAAGPGSTKSGTFQKFQHLWPTGFHKVWAFAGVPEHWRLMHACDWSRRVACTWKFLIALKMFLLCFCVSPSSPVIGWLLRYVSQCTKMLLLSAMYKDICSYCYMIGRRSCHSMYLLSSTGEWVCCPPPVVIRV